MNFLARLLLIAVIFPGVVSAQSRIRDLVDIEGVRENPIQGIGLVIGLNGTGDGATLTRQAAANMFKRNGLNVPIGNIAPENMAMVMVSAMLPPFARPGSKIDMITRT